MATTLRRSICILALALVTTLWSSALLAAPSADPPHFSALVYAAGSRICHQRPERSFHRHGAQYPVCARCLGLYTGAVAGVLGWGLIAGVGSIARPRFRQGWPAVSARRLLVMTGLPTLFTVVTAFIGWWDPGNVIRAALAFPVGAVIAAVVTAVAAGDLK
jgi:uncharacterized membrane protein